MQIHSISVPKTAHYCTLGEPGPHIKYFWICCHGYGQLAKRFIRKFESIHQEDTLVVAPEGFSRFYWKDFTGDVVASWMTREDRLDEIADYSSYIQTLYNQYLWQLPDDVKIILFGFSQGCATQVRWIMRHLPSFDHLVLWAGFLPDDLDYTPQNQYFQSKTIDFVCGNEDQFLTEERLKMLEGIIEKSGLEIRKTMFAGKHIVDREVLKQFTTEHIRNNT